MKKDYSQDNFPKIIIAIFLFVLGIWVGRNVALPFLPEAGSKINVLNRLNSKDDVDFTSFWQVWDKLNLTYLNKKDLSGQKLLQGAISGLVNAAGDPYTLYFDPEANKSFGEQISGNFEGVGIELGSKDNSLIVIAPIEGSPASKAGILSGDKILSIDNKDSSRMSIGDAVKQIRGKAGTKVKLTISREGSKREYEITRENIIVKTVKIQIKEDVAVINITQFGENTKSEWDKAVNQVTTSGIKKIVIDLRNDPGGLLEDATYIAGDFVDNGTTLLQEEDSNGERQKFQNDKDPRLKDISVVILINKGSASASEIVTGALIDNDKAKTVGETSFGKGTVQSVTNLKDGAGLHITVAKWLTPKGTWVHGKGITPDYPVARSEDDIKNNLDPQLIKALELFK